MWRVLLLCLPTATMAESVVAARTIRAGEALVAEDMMLVEADIPGALTTPEEALGQEARVAIYAGRPILRRTLGPQTTVERNQIVTLNYRAGGLSIRTEGRALARGGSGDVVEAMNLMSKTRVSGRIEADGTLTVGPSTLP